MNAATLVTLTTPHVKAFLDAGDYAPLLDWLQDQDAGLDTLAVLFAGSPPGHADGLPQEWLARWLELTGREGDAEAVRGCVLEQYEGRRPREWAEGIEPWYRLRWHLVDDVTYRIESPIPSLGRAHRASSAVLAVLGESADAPPLEHDLALASEELARARRDLKRRVLSLPVWDSVVVTRQVEAGDAPIFAWMSARDLVQVDPPLTLKTAPLPCLSPVAPELL